MGLKKKNAELQEAAATSQAVYQCSGRGHVHGEGPGAWERGHVHGGGVQVHGGRGKGLRDNRATGEIC